MIELPELMEAIATQIANAADITTADYFPENISPPFVFLTLDSLREEVFGFGSYGVTINVVVLVAAQDALSGQRLVYDYATPGSARSIFAALTADDSFGLIGVSSRPGEFRSIGAEEIALYRYYGGVLPLEVAVT